MKNDGVDAVRRVRLPGGAGRRRLVTRAPAKWLRFVVAGVLAVALAGCGGSGSASKSSELTVGIPAGLANLDPAKDTWGTHAFFRYLAYEPILTLDPSKGTYGPGLAETYGYVGQGNTTYEFTLRKDARFADGAVVNAAAVKKWLDYFGKAGGPMAPLFPVKSVETVGEWTVRLHLSAPTPTVPVYLSSSNWGFVSEVDPARLSKETLGAGPYTLVPSESVEGDHYTFKPNENYPDKSVQHFKSVVVKVIESHSAMLSAIRSGGIDLALGDDSTAAAAASASGITVLQTPAGWAGLELYDLTGKISPLGDVRVRQALNYAVDRKSITNALMRGYAQPTSTWVPFGGLDQGLADYYGYDPGKAKKLLAEAGYPNGFALKILVQGWTGNMGNPMGQALAADFKKVGVDLQITTPTSTGDYYQQVLSGHWAAALVAQTGAAPAYALSATRWLPGGNLNLFKYNDPVLIGLIRKGASAPLAEGNTYWQAISDYVVKKAYMVPVSTAPIIVYLANDRVTGLSKENVTGSFSWSPAILEARPR